MSNSSKRSVIEEQFDALARRQLAAALLGRDALLAAAEPRAGAAVFERVEDVLHVGGSAAWVERMRRTVPLACQAAGENAAAWLKCK